MEIHDHSKPDIIQFGSYRSGSTFMYQYLKNLFPTHKILKYHAYRTEEVPVVITVRDHRDSVSSYWRVEYPLENSGEKAEIGKTFMTKSDIDKYSSVFFDQDSVLHDYLLNQSKVLVLQYESFLNNFEYLHPKVEKFFDLRIDNSRRERIESQCSLEHNKKVQEQFEDFSKYDKSTGIHGDHILTGESTWKQFTPVELHEYFTDKMSPLLKTWNYA
jgi:hypothetical protein